MANGVIPKPTFWTFAFYKMLKGFECIYRSNEAVIVSDGEGQYRGIVWNSSLKRCKKSVGYDFEIEVPEDKKGEYSIVYKTVDEDVCNPLKVWHDLGEPSSLTAAEKDILRQAAAPQITSDRLDATDGYLKISGTVNEFGVVYFECKRCDIKPDRGFSYERTVQI